MAQHWADRYITKIDGPFGIGRSCKLCSFGVTAKKPAAGFRGRGWGMREGNKLRGQLIQHIKTEHADRKPKVA